MEHFYTTLILFFLVMDPLGNLPVFITELDSVQPNRYRSIVLRESLIALGLLLLFLFCGNSIMKYLQISKASLELAGGIILFMISVKLVFGTTPGEAPIPKTLKREPFIVPLAIPLFAGPASMSTAILVGGGAGATKLLIGAAALISAWGICTVILLSGRFAAKIMGSKALSALETLMGLLLTTFAVEMMIKGIKYAFLT